MREADFQNCMTRLSHSDYHVRLRAVRELASSGDSRAVPLLLKLLGDFDERDEESKVNRSAAESLSGFGEAALQLTIAALKPDPAFPAKQDNWRRYWAADALRFFKDARAVPTLIECLHAGNPRELVEGAALTLGHLGDRRALEPLRQLQKRLHREDGFVYMAVRLAIQTIEARE
jgi:HEAT repeat protein